MPTDKRQRQRAAREARRAELTSAHKRRAARNRAIAIAVVIALVLLILALVAGNGDADNTDVAADATTTTGVEREPVAYGATPCPPAEGAAERTVTFDAPFEKCLEEGTDYVATIEFDNGTVQVDLAEDQSPLTVNNFVSLARHQFYDGTVCHRVIKNFVVQCGDPEGTGRGGPGYTISEEPPASGRYEIGQLAMAKAMAPGSTGSQFFIITGENGAALPPDYSLLGEITSGMNVAEEIEADGAASDPSPPAKIHTIKKITIEEK